MNRLKPDTYITHSSGGNAHANNGIELRMGANGHRVGKFQVQNVF